MVDKDFFNQMFFNPMFGSFTIINAVVVLSYFLKNRNLFCG